MARAGSGLFSPPHHLDPYGSEPEAAGGEGCPASPSASCSSLYRRRCQRHPSGRAGRPEQGLREGRWASPVRRRRPHGPGFLSGPSKPPSACASSSSLWRLEQPPGRARQEKLSGRGWREACESGPGLTEPRQPFGGQGEDEEEEETRAESYDETRSDYHLQRSRRREPRVSLEDLIDKRYQDLIPERDRKIAALMLARRQEAQDQKERQLQTFDAWDKMRRRQKKLQSRLEKEKQHYQAESLEKWQREREHRKARLKREERQLLKAREKEMMLQDMKWEKLAQEQEMRRKQKLERTKFQAEYRKHCQEKQLREKRIAEKNAKQYNYDLLKEKMARAFEKRLLKEMEEKKRSRELNHYEKAKQRHLKAQMDHQVKADELYRRLSIEQKLQRSQEILDHLMEERNRELKEKSLRDEEQGLLAKFRAKETEEEKRRRKSMLLQIAEMKIQQAQEIMSKNVQDKAQCSKENNYLKEINHHFQKQKLEDDEKCHLREIQGAIKRKNEKSNRILRDKEATVEDSRKIARASYDLRDKVRELIDSHSFD